ncbi:MAG TPA: septum formation initiator family protein [Gemmatimonadaceae bacterium]|nr:septum formation initiator family protein [Gemmatimonadaceae bacterium]
MPKRRFDLKLLLWLVVLVAAVVFAVQGGEYGTSDLFRQHARRTALQAAVDSLQREVDSLRRYRAAIATDPRVQERIAREEFGMIRPGELLYRLVPTASNADSGGGDGDR